MSHSGIAMYVSSVFMCFLYSYLVIAAFHGSLESAPLSRKDLYHAIRSIPSHLLTLIPAQSRRRLSDSKLKPKTKPRSTTTQGLSAANLNPRPRPAFYSLALGPPSRTLTHCMTRSWCPVPRICQLALISCLVAVSVGDSHHGLRSLVSGSVKFIGQSPSL